MPYTKKKKSSYSRPGYRTCGRMVLNDATKALVVARNLKRLLNVEVKNFDVQITSLALTQTPIIRQISNIPTGDTTNTRDGAQCKMVGINVNYELLVNPTTPRTSVRVILIIDKQTNQAIYTDSDFLEDATVLDNIISPRNLNNKHRFTVLSDRVHMLSLDRPAIVVRSYFKKDVLLRFDASTPSIADLTQNSISLMLITNEATNVPSITLFTRLRFVDN